VKMSVVVIGKLSVELLGVTAQNTTVNKIELEIYR
jgi:hypothetical protein